MQTCDWCGADHPVAQLCHGRPRWSRRGFVALLGAGLVGAVLSGRLGSSLSLNASQSGRMFVYDAHTIRRWQEEAIKLAPKCPWIVTPQLTLLSMADLEAISRLKDAAARS